MDELEYNVQWMNGYFMVHKWTGGAMPEVSYKVTVNKKDQLECGCPSGRYRGYCKHKQMVREYIRADKDGKLGHDGVMWFKG